MQDLHRDLRDGTVEHAEFSRSSWEDGLINPLVRSQWTHPPGECRDEFFDSVLAEGREQLVQSPPDCSAPPERADWPPPTALQPWMLQQMTTLGPDDARAALAGPRKKAEESERRPVADGRGQYGLF